MRQIVLLDLNYTLIGNSVQRRRVRPWTLKLAGEAYRPWMVRMLAGRDVILITARAQYQKEQTMRQLRERIPELEFLGSFFNEHSTSPPISKRRALMEHIFPQWGRQGEGVEYVAWESNGSTRQMYLEFGIPSMLVGLDPMTVEEAQRAEVQETLF